MQRDRSSLTLLTTIGCTRTPASQMSSRLNSQSVSRHWKKTDQEDRKKSSELQLFFHRTKPLKDKGNKAFHVALIRCVLVRKFLEHEFFLVAQFDPNAHEYQWHGDDSGHVPEHDHGCDEHGQEPGINRMAHQRVRPACNQFVAAFEGHDAAPISSEREPGPDTKGQTGNA